jgi:hypothetical protein
MRHSPGVFITDQVIDQMRIPASELMRSDHNHHRERLRRGVGLGMPAQMQHDMHRLIGWSRPLGLYVDSEMVRALGLIEEPETGQEKAELQARAAAYWEQYHCERAEPYREELIARVAPADLGNARFLQIEAVVVERLGIAAELYPELFKPGLGSVDKDGLADYRDLLRRMKQVQPGVFHDCDCDLLLFAHRFFRRSLSHRNKLNAYFLQSFDATARENGDLRVRLKLDPDLVGHPASARNLIELERWRGPLYSDDIAMIPNGVAEHKADEQTKLYEGVDRTQVWWKPPKSRYFDGQAVDYRTLEIEELIENPSGGLGENQFGCRYAHAEFSADEAAITHFDGAVRAYAWEPYLERIETSIDRAGKHADYTKVFRFDGTLAIPHWKRLLSDFFRGNNLIPEYLGAPVEVDEKPEAESSADILAPAEEAALAALISLQPGSVEGQMLLGAELYQELAGQKIPFVEVGVGEVEKHIRTHNHIDLSDTTTVGFRDGILNLSRLVFGTLDDLKASFDTEVSALAVALRHDAEGSLIRRAAIPLTWEDGGLLVTLTIAGDANKVAAVLQQLPVVIDPTQPPSEWIEPLGDLIKATTPRQRSPVMWDGVYRGVLAIGRTGVVEQQMLMPNALMQRLLSSGKLKIGKAEPEHVARAAPVSNPSAGKPRN